MSYSSSYLTNVQARADSSMAAVFYYANWDTDDLSVANYITSASAVGIQQYDLIYAIHPVNGGQKWYAVRDVVSDVPVIDLLGTARDIAYVDLAVLAADISDLAKWYSTAFIVPPSVTSGVARSLNSPFTVSTSRLSHVTYTARLEVTNPLILGNSQAELYLETSPNGSTWTTVSNALSRSAVGGVVAFAITDRKELVVSGFVPANYQVRLRSATSGTASVAYVLGQETLL